MKIKVILLIITIFNITNYLYAQNSKLDFNQKIIISFDDSAGDCLGASSEGSSEASSEGSSEGSSEVSSEASSEAGLGASSEGSSESSKNSDSSEDSGNSSDDSSENSSGSSSDSCKKTPPTKPVNKTVKFVAKNMQAVAKDMARGDGEYLDTLADFMEIHEKEQFNKTLQDNYSKIYTSENIQAEAVVTNINTVWEESEAAELIEFVKKNRIHLQFDIARGYGYTIKKLTRLLEEENPQELAIILKYNYLKIFNKIKITSKQIAININKVYKNKYPDNLKNFVKNNLISLEENIARGYGWYLDELADLLYIQEKKTFRLKLQNNYQKIFTVSAYSIPEELIINIKNTYYIEGNDSAEKYIFKNRNMLAYDMSKKRGKHLNILFNILKIKSVNRTYYKSLLFNNYEKIYQSGQISDKQIINNILDILVLQNIK